MNKIGSLIDIEIIDIGHKGEAIGKFDGITIFVEGGSILGDKVQAEIIKIKPNYMVAKLKKIIKPSPHRIESPCQVSKLCGGCQLIDMNYQAQLVLKESQVFNTLSRIGKTTDFEKLSIIGMNEPFFYRNKSQLPVGLEYDEIQLGFYEQRSHKIVDIDECIIQDENNNKEVITAIREFLKNNKNEIYNEQNNSGNIRRIITKVGFSTNQLMVVIVTKNKNLQNKEVLIKLLKTRLPNLTTIVQNINPTKNNNVMGDENVVLYGQGKINEYLEDVLFEISPHSFFQVNPKQTLVMYNKVLEFAEINETSTVIDLYCGLGSISLFVGRKAKFVYGIEVVEAAIQDAKKNAILNKMEEKTKFICGKAEEVLPRLYKKGIRADVIIVDPPRKGCEEILLKTIAEMNVKKLIYVSCNPSTLARDIEILEKQNYKLQKVQPIDNFCHSMHVECVVKLCRVEK